MKYEVFATDEYGDELSNVGAIHFLLSEAETEADRLSADETHSVFIRSYRPTDRQTVYYNRDGAAPVGNAW